MNISSCLIVKNGGSHIRDLVDQLLEFSKEVIIVDTGSDDGTPYLLDSYNPKVKIFNFDWIDDFAAARNFSFSKAAQDWIFWCDADDTINPELIENLKKLRIRKLYNSVLLNYEFAPNYWVPRVRLLRRDANPTWHHRIHEYVDCDNMCTKDLSDHNTYGYIIHSHRDGAHTDRNLRIYFNQICNLEDLDARQLHYYANELYDNKYYDKAFEVYQKCIDNQQNFDKWSILVKMYYASQITGRYSDEWLNEVSKVEESIGLRGDVLGCLGMYFNGKDNKLAIKYYTDAINTDATDWDAVNEDIELSKIISSAELIKLHADNPEACELAKQIHASMCKKYNYNDDKNNSGENGTNQEVVY